MSLAESTSVFATDTWQPVPFVTEMSRTSPADGVRLLSLAATLQSALRLIVAALTVDGDATAIPQDSTAAETKERRGWRELNIRQ